MTFIISAKEIEAHYDVLSKIGNLGEDSSSGYFRAAYSDEETQAMRHFESQAKSLGFVTRWDAYKNLFIEIPGESSDFVEVGSHLDTVPNGGNFDGVAGIVAGFEALKAISSKSGRTKRGLRLRIWRAEEGALYGTAFSGSLSAFGKLDTQVLSRSYNTGTLKEAMLSQGVDVLSIEKKIPSISQNEIDSIAAHLELHIEQATVLERSKFDIGIVTSIRASRRMEVRLKGEFNHSGATPMGVEFRSDVNLALGYILVRLDEHYQNRVKSDVDIVQTIGVINSDRVRNEQYQEVYQNAVTKVSGFAYFLLDVRSNNDSFRKTYAQEAEQIIRDTAKEFDVEVEIELLGDNVAIAQLNQEIQNVFQQSSDVLNLSSLKLPCGAGHDCMIVAEQRKSNGSGVPIGMLFIPCRDGVSHSPEEWTSFEAIAKGASVLANSMFVLSNS